MRPTLSDVFYVRIDKNRKLPVTVLLRALGLSTDEEILEFFGDAEPKHRRHSREGHHPKHARRLCWRFTASCAPVSPRRWKTPSAHLNSLFFDPRRYDLSRVGRYKMQQQAQPDPPHCRL